MRARSVLRTRPGLLHAALASLFLAAACGQGFSADDRVESTARPLNIATDLRIAVWNVQTVGTPGSTEYDGVLAVLQRIDADVVGINEVNGSDLAPVDNFASLAADAGYAHTLVPASNPLGSLRNAFLSKFPFASTAILTSPDLSGDVLANDLTRNIVQITVDLPDNDRHLILLVEHWKSGTADTDQFRRAIESFRLAQAVAALDPATDAFVFMGDMNEEIDSVPRSPNPFTSVPSGLPGSFVVGSDILAVLAGPGLVNDPFHYLQRTPEPDAVALPALQLDGDDGTRPASGRRLDYILVSQAINALGPEVEVYDSNDEGLSGGLPKVGAAPNATASTDASDHLMVFADITVPKGPGCTQDAECDDGVFCTGVERCIDDVCEPGTPPANGTSCSDGDACNGLETCQSGSCTPGAPPDCDDSNPCTDDSCDTVLGCQNPAVSDGASCDDGDVCNGDESCQAGTCTGGTALQCADDSNPCTVAACDAVFGCGLENAVDGTSCADSNMCNGAESCRDGICIAGPDPDCDDDNECTADTCEVETGCANRPRPTGTSCDGGGGVCDAAGTCRPRGPVTEPPPETGGCASAGGSPGATWLLLVLAAGLIRRRRHSWAEPGSNAAGR